MGAPSLYAPRRRLLDCRCGHAYEGPAGARLAAFLAEHAPCDPAVPCPGCDIALPAAARPASCGGCGLPLSWAV